MLITLFARKEPTTDPVDIALGLQSRKDAVFYRDRGCTERFVRWSWYLSSCPRRGRKTVTLNCFKYRVEWV